MSNTRKSLVFIPIPLGEDSSKFICLYLSCVCLSMVLWAKCNEIFWYIVSASAFVLYMMDMDGHYDAWVAGFLSIEAFVVIPSAGCDDCFEAFDPFFLWLRVKSSHAGRRSTKAISLHGLYLV